MGLVELSRMLSISAGFLGPVGSHSDCGDGGGTDVSQGGDVTTPSGQLGSAR